MWSESVDEELKREELSIEAISKLTGRDGKTIRKYLIKPPATPVYVPRSPRPRKLEGFKSFVAGPRAPTVDRRPSFMRNPEKVLPKRVKAEKFTPFQ